MSTRLSVSAQASGPDLPAGGLGRISARTVYLLAGRTLRACWALAAVLGVLGLLMGLLVAPADLQQGELYRIMFVHLPAAWMSLALYGTMTLAAGVGLLLQHRLASMLAAALAPTGALMTCITLWSGALWGKPEWGTWWIWDARLTCELLLLVLFVAFIALRATIADRHLASRATAWLSLTGAAALPLVFALMLWWGLAPPDADAGPARALHLGNVVVAAAMVLMVAAFWAWCLGTVLHRLRSIMIEHSDELQLTAEPPQEHGA